MRRLGLLVACAAPFACVSPAAASGPASAAAWAIQPDESSCHTDLELSGRSGSLTPLTLSSDGERVSLRFAMEAPPERAFLPIRVDQKAYANLVLRGDGPGLAVMTLSDETLSALRRGKTLQIAWLSDEAVRGALAGAAQGIADLKLCGAQVAGRWRAVQQAAAAARARADAEARDRAMADEQLAAVRAQRQAAEAEGRRQAADAARASAEAQRAAAEAERLSAQAAQDRAYAEQARQRAEESQFRSAQYDPAPVYEQRDYPAPPQDRPPPPPWGYPRYAPRW